MVFIKKDVNQILLFLTIIPIILFITLSIHYENKIKDISSEYNQKIENFQYVSGKAVLERLNETIGLKETALQDKEKLENEYYQLKIENEALSKEKERLQAESDLLKSQLQSQNAKFNRLESDFNQVQNSLIEANEAISKLLSRVQELCRRLEANGEKC